VVPSAWRVQNEVGGRSREAQKRAPDVAINTRALKRRLKMKKFISVKLSIHENWRNDKMQKKAPREKGLSTIPRGSLHPVKLNLLFIIGEKSARM
jgi:hypothetical protein